MKLSGEDVIEYTFRDVNDNELKVAFNLVSIEGSTPNFYQHIREAFKNVDCFDIEHCQIVERKLITNVINYKED